MALTRQQKQDTLSKLETIFVDAKIVVFAGYSGLTVEAAQQLRRQAKDTDVFVGVFKNRLVKLALANHPNFKDIDSSMLKGQLLYSTSSEDEVAPAQLLAKFGKEFSAVELKGAFDSSGKYLDEQQVKQLAELPSKDQLRAQLVGTMAAPLSGLVNVLGGNIRGLVNVLSAASSK